MTLSLHACVLACVLSFAFITGARAAPDPLTVCPDQLPAMREVLASVRAGLPLTDEQHQRWRTWNQHCRGVRWQRDLAADLPPVETRAPVPLPLTWRDYAIGALQGFERGATAPMTVCRTEVARRGARVGAYTSCLTH